MIKLDFCKKKVSLRNLGEKEKGLIAAVFLLPSLIATVFFLLAPFLS